MEHLLRLVESAPLVDLQHRVCELLKTGERSLEDHSWLHWTTQKWLVGGG